MKHYFKNGNEHTGGTHKDSKGKLMSGVKHTANSKFLFHKNELSATAKKSINLVKKK